MPASLLRLRLALGLLAPSGREDLDPPLDRQPTLANRARTRPYVEQRAATLKIPREVIRDMVQAVDESASNIILHGYRGKPGTIEVEIRREGDSLVAYLRDQAPPFDPTSVPPPDLTLPLHKRPMGGLGVYLVKQLMDSVSHRLLPDGSNELSLSKRLA